MNQRKLLLTGAAGRIGSFLTEHLLDYLEGDYTLVLSDVKEPSERHGFPFQQADISDIEAMRTLCQGVDTVLHLAADPSPRAAWDSLLPNNIIGVYTVFQAAYENQCRRVIFASSVNAVSGYPAEIQVTTSMPVRPPNLYGATKVWGEAVARFYADQMGLSAICLRFGGVSPRSRVEGLPADAANLDIILTLDDLTRLVAAAIETDRQFGIYHGVSDNRYKRLDISDARDELAYEPQDDAFKLAGQSNGPV